MQDAVLENLKQLAVRHPTRKVILLAFSDEVVFYGDGVDSPQVVTGDALLDETALDKFIATLSLDGVKPILQSNKALDRRVSELTENGATALGPALYIAAQLAGKKAHSEIILCTDGLSNVGLGSLDEKDTMEEASKFYKAVAAYSKAHETTINIMALQDSNCALSSFAVVATETSGQVNILHPLEWAAEVQRIAQNPVIATNVHARLLLPSLLTNPRREKCDACGGHSGANFVCYNVGNATAETDLAFDMQCVPSMSYGDTVPFQLQITYTRVDGAQCMRVISTEQKITKDRARAEKGVDVAVLALYAVQRTARLALQKDLESARNILFGTTSLLKRAADSPTQREELCAFSQEVSELDRIVRMAMKDTNLLQEDATAKMLHRAKNAPLSLFLSGSRKNIGRREKGVFSDGELREWYYNKKF